MAKIDKKENNTVHFSLEISGEDFENALQKAYLTNRGKIMMPGFRKGKVPRKIIEMHYGEDVFYDDAINDILPEIYEKAIDELELDVVDQPHVDLPEEIVKGNPILVNIQVDVKPEVELASYDDLEVEEVVYEFDESMIDSELESAREKNARLINVEDRPIEDGDLVNIDYEGTIEGEAFDGGADQGIDLHIGSNTFIPGFETGLIGKAKGDELDLNLTFPEDYHATDLAGKDVVFNVVINEIQIRELPEMDDEFIKDISEFDTVEEYKADVRETMIKDLKEKEEQEKEARAIQAFSEMIEVDIPNGMIESGVNDELQNLAMQLSGFGMTLEQYLSMVGQTIDDVKAKLRDGALNTVKSRLVLEAIAAKEKFEVTDEEIREEVTRIADMYANYDEEAKANYVEEMMAGEAVMLKKGIEQKKAIKFLVEKAKFVKKDVVADEVKEEENTDK